MVNKLKSKAGFIIGGMVAIAALGLFLCYYYLAPNSYLAIDVNPSIEFKTNRLNQVVSINPVNDDAKNLLTGYELKDKHIEKVIQDIVDRMVLTGYLTPGKDNMILITVEDKNTSLNLLKDVKEDLQSSLSDRKIEAEVMEQSITITTDDILEAHNNNISAGKLAIINKIMKFDKSITVEELSEVSILDMIAYADLYDIELDDLIDDFDDVEEYVFDNSFDNKDTLKEDSIQKGDSIKISEDNRKDSNYVHDDVKDRDDDRDDEDNQADEYDDDDNDDDNRSVSISSESNKLNDVNNYKQTKDRTDITDKDDEDDYEDTDDIDDKDDIEDEDDFYEVRDGAAKHGDSKNSDYNADYDADEDRDEEDDLDDEENLDDEEDHHDDDDDGVDDYDDEKDED